MRIKRKLYYSLLFFFSAVPVTAQNAAQNAQPQAPGQAARSVATSQTRTQTAQFGAQNPFLGGVTSGEATSDEIPLSLSEAIERGLKNNLGKILTEQRGRSAVAQQMQARSGLLPTVNGQISETEQQINLAAFGLEFPGVNPIVGPFGVFDSRLYLSQPVLDLRAISNSRAGSENAKAANYSYADSRDVVVTVVATLYLQAAAASSRIEAAEAQVNTAQAVYDQAVSFKQNGLVPGIEVLRAQVELQARRQQLIFAQNEFEKAKLGLGRAIGLPLGQRFRLSETVQYTPLPPMSLDESLQHAYQMRSDYQSALAAVRAAEHTKDAAERERMPVLSVNGDYGALGRRPNSSHGTFVAAARLQIPIFEGGRIRADIQEADSDLQRQKAELEETRSRIEYDIRTAFMDLKGAGERVGVATSALDLARQQIQQAQDRFAAGVTGNIEVVQAQEALATATENLIASTYDYNVAKTFLARALGGAEQGLRQILVGAPK